MNLNSGIFNLSLQLLHLWNQLSFVILNRCLNIQETNRMQLIFYFLHPRFNLTNHLLSLSVSVDKGCYSSIINNCLLLVMSNQGFDEFLALEVRLGVVYLLVFEVS